MALPTSRNTNYLALAQIKSADLNEIQDWLIEHHDELHTIANRAVPAGSNSQPANGANWVPGLNGQWQSTIGTPGKLYLEIPMKAGEVISAVTVWVKQSIATAGLITATLEQFGISTGLRTVQSANVGSAASVALQGIVLTAITAGALPVDGLSIFDVLIDGTATVATREIYGATVAITKP